MHNDEVDVSSLVEAVGRERERRFELTQQQTAAMQSLDEAVRAAEVGPEDAAAIEEAIRAGKVAGALKRLTRARHRVDHG